MAAGRPDDALQHARQALFLADRAQAPEVAFQWLWRIGGLQAAAGETDQAIRTLQQGVETVGTIRSICSPSARGRAARCSARWSARVPRAGRPAAQAGAAQTAPAARQDYLREARAAVETLRAAELEDYFQDDCVAELQARVRPIDQLGERTAALYPIVLPDRRSSS